MSSDIEFNDLLDNSDFVLQVEKHWYPLYYRYETDEQRIFIGNAVIDLMYADKYMETASWSYNDISDWCGNIHS